MENQIQLGVVYKIYCNNPDVEDIYVGSTVDLKKRLYQHKNSCKNGLSPVHRFINENGGLENWCVEILEEFCICNKKHLLERERFWYDKLKPTLNKHRPSISYDELIEYHVNFREQNKDKKNEYNKEYYSKNKKYWAEYYKKKKCSVEQINITITFD